MPTLSHALIRHQVDVACNDLLTLLTRGNQQLLDGIKNAKSPQDIENNLFREISFIKLLGHKINAAPPHVKRAYPLWGIKVESILEIVADLPVIEAWIEWFKHQRSQQLGPIRETEAFLPIDPNFELTKAKYHKGRRIFSLEYNSVVPGTRYRIKQAEYYAKVLCTIFCSPSPPPPLGKPLPPDSYKIDFEDIPKTRSEIARTIFEPNKTFGQTLELITKYFVNTSIKTGTTSELLPHMQIERVHTYLPDSHPIRLAAPSRKTE